MINSRYAVRSNRIDSCLLNSNGETYACTLENISLTGAMVNCGHEFRNIRPGNSCGLNLCNDPTKYNEYSCQVVRITSSKIGLRFINY